MLKPYGWPRVRSWNEVPEGLLQAAVLGAVAGPLVGFFAAWMFQAGWHPPHPDLGTFLKWLAFAARAGTTYSLVYYLFLRLSVDYLRDRYDPSGTIIWLLYFSAWAVSLAALGALLPRDEQFGRAIRESFSNPQALHALVGAAILFVAIGIFTTALDRSNARREAAEARAQIKVLEAQINPHFFFNTLNTIYALIEIDPAAAQRTVALLAEMNRQALRQPGLIPLTQELDFANTYLQIEKVRFGDRLQYQLPQASDAEGIHVPAFGVQPLIENAIRHGIARSIEGGKVSVTLDRQGKRFCLTVENDCEPSSDLSERLFFREGHALHNIRERLRFYFGDNASLAVAFPQPSTVAVTITGPIS
jgi:Histidine kinase